ncbi:hypothetical protein KKI24_02330 [bacterium]|nr:hypothetical protein [bacterium]
MNARKQKRLIPGRRPTVTTEQRKSTLFSTSTGSAGQVGYDDTDHPGTAGPRTRVRRKGAASVRDDVVRDR